MTQFKVPAQLRFAILFIITSILTVGASATIPHANAAKSPASVLTAPANQMDADINQTCQYNKTVNTEFNFIDTAGNAYGLRNTHAFTIQFTNLNYCYNGSTIQWASRPEARAYVKNYDYFWDIAGRGNWYNILSMTCGEKFDFPGNGNQPNLYITCELGISSNDFAGLSGFKSNRDVDGSSVFDIPARLNWNFFGTFGPPSVGGGLASGVQQPRYYTLRIGANGQAWLSGVGTPYAFTP